MCGKGSAGRERNRAALALRGVAQRRKRQWLKSDGIEYQRIAMAMNGQEWLWKSYEGKSFATEIPLKQL